MHTKVYIDNLATVTTEQDLIELFSPYGYVAQANVSINRISGRQRGFGFVTMATSEGARTAIRALHGKEVGTHNLIVSEAWLHEERAGPSGSPEIPNAVPAILTGPPLKDAS